MQIASFQHYEPLNERVDLGSLDIVVRTSSNQRFIRHVHIVSSTGRLNHVTHSEDL